jgi:hypothetical protein
MSIRNELLGGTDFTDGTVLYSEDLNDTFDAAAIYSDFAAYNIFIVASNYTSSTGTWYLVNEQGDEPLSFYMKNLGNIGDDLTFKIFLIPGTYKVTIGFRGGLGFSDTNYFKIDGTSQFTYSTHDSSNTGKVTTNTFTTSLRGVYDLKIEKGTADDTTLSFISLSKTS